MPRIDSNIRFKKLGIEENENLIDRNFNQLVDQTNQLLIYFDTKPDTTSDTRLTQQICKSFLYLYSKAQLIYPYWLIDNTFVITLFKTTFEMGLEKQNDSFFIGTDRIKIAIATYLEKYFSNIVDFLLEFSTFPGHGYIKLWAHEKMRFTIESYYEKIHEQIFEANSNLIDAYGDDNRPAEFFHAIFNPRSGEVIEEHSNTTQSQKKIDLSASLG
jgi:hypothetical protein